MAERISYGPRRVPGSSGMRSAGHRTETAFAVGVASKSSIDGHVGHVTPSSGLFGSPVRAKAPMLRIMASDSARRPAWLARVYEMLAYSDGPKLPKANGKSNACAAP